MQAIRFHAFGDPSVLKLETLPIPVPGPGEVRVRVHAAGVNPVDWKIRSGFAGALVANILPTVAGTEMAGTIDALGEGVTGWSVGDAVMAQIGLWGGYAEYAIAPVSLLAPKPANVSFLQASAASLALVTAWGAVTEAGEVKAGQRVLVLGGAGGVGGAAVQIARNLGAEVIATSSLAKRDRVIALGAESIAYDAPDETVIAPVDTIIDCVGAEQAQPFLKLLKADGLYVAVVHPGDAETVQAAGHRAVWFPVEPSGAKLTKVAAQVAAGEIILPDAIGFPLADAGKAQAISETGHAPARLALIMPGIAS